MLTPIQVRTRKAKRALAARGLTEAVTWSFVSKREAELFGGGKPELALANPIAAELSDMRPSLMAGLITSAQRNADRGTTDVALFEVGQIFKGDRPEDQFTAASGLRRGLAALGQLDQALEHPAQRLAHLNSGRRADARDQDLLGQHPRPVRRHARAPALLK